jgi:hypothetical protein
MIEGGEEMKRFPSEREPSKRRKLEIKPVHKMGGYRLPELTGR